VDKLNIRFVICGSKIENAPLALLRLNLHKLSQVMDLENRNPVKPWCAYISSTCC